MRMKMRRKIRHRTGKRGFQESTVIQGEGRRMMEQGMILSFFGGVSQDGSGWAVDLEKVFYELGRWLLPIGICLLAEGVRLERWRKIELLSRYRYGSVQIWWKRKFVRGLRDNVFTAVLLFLVAMAADVVSGAGVAEEGWRALFLWLSHVVMVMSLFLIMDLTGLRGLAPAILLLLEGFTFLLGFMHMGTARLMYGMWGMYFQSQWHFGEAGVPVSVSLVSEGIVLALVYLAGGIFFRGETLSAERGSCCRRGKRGAGRNDA